MQANHQKQAAELLGINPSQLRALLISCEARGSSSAHRHRPNETALNHRAYWAAWASQPSGQRSDAVTAIPNRPPNELPIL